MGNDQGFIWENDQEIGLMGLKQNTGDLFIKGYLGRTSHSGGFLCGTYNNVGNNDAKTNPIFGTCAGMILLSSSEGTKNLSPLSIMDFTVARNAWGRQIFSFTKEVDIYLPEQVKYIATFIRAPKIITISDSINILSKLDKEIILITDGMHLASSFHPEFGVDAQIHDYFIQLVRANEKINSL